MTIQSTKITLKEVVRNNHFFNIPIYQRLYVWEEDQIKTLLEDIETAFDTGKEIFFLGGVLVVENDSLDNGVVYDLIDGQQRFTTLWMLSIILSADLEPFIERKEIDKNRHRVSFAIRDDIYKYFKHYIAGIKEGKANTNIENALAYIDAFKKELEKKRQGKSIQIAKFIYQNVQLIFTEVPKATDLNKLFEIINNRGIQLQHHEILKAQLLNKLHPQDRLNYSYLWDASSFMENYVEKNIKDIAKVKIQDLYENDIAKNGNEKLSYAKEIINVIVQKENTKHMTLSLDRILKRAKDEIEDDEIEDDETYESDQVRSIITFPMLLQHTLRIFLVQKNKKDISKILDKELLNIFKIYFIGNKKNEELKQDTKEFIELLYEVRYAFDKYIIKWVPTDDSEIHLISALYKQKNEQRGKTYYTLSRRQPTANEGEALLQSLLYHSQQITTHYWLTPYLKYLLDFRGKGSFNYLKHLDNNLLCSNESEGLILRTRKFLDDYRYKTKLDTSILKKQEGTSFPHYWFYKLEFVLWTINNNKDDRWKNFKFTAKNSVEHISPQIQKHTDINMLSDDMLDKFGNLALVSRSLNSEYSNLPFNEKRTRFENNNRLKLDSLKMDLIYANKSWNDDIAMNHQKEMIKYLDDYLNQNYL